MGAQGGARAVNIYILGYLVLCLIVGLWAPRKQKTPAVVVTLAVALVLFFTLSSSRL
jgi:hypothetical protein